MAMELDGCAMFALAVVSNALTDGFPISWFRKLKFKKTFIKHLLHVRHHVK